MSPASGGRAVRAARAGGGVAAAVLVALAAHLAGGGAAPSPVLVAAVLALAWPAGLLLVGRRARLWRQAAVVGVAQAMLHAVFAAGAAVGAGDAMAGMHGPLPTATAAMPMPAGPAMTAAHLAAWAATTLAWRWGEAALHRVLAGLPHRRALALLEPVMPPAAARAARSVLRRTIARPALLAAHRDRGPPLPA